jgi:hypothetical protein
MKNASFLVLIYNKKICESKTLNSLLESNVKFNNCDLVIWNNGPKHLKDKELLMFEEKGFSCQLVETIENIALSKIYNQFIEKSEACKYVILDDDSVLNDGYLNCAIESKDDQIIVPPIIVDGRITGPLINNKIYDSSYNYGEMHTVVAIGSGLILGKDIFKLISSRYNDIFDENFYFYGVDSSFFHRINKLNLASNVEICDSIDHSLSRLQEESEEIKSFRRKERSYDLGLQIRNYFPLFKKLNVFFKINVKCIINILLSKERNVDLNYFYDALITGKHYKNK